MILILKITKILNRREKTREEVVAHKTTVRTSMYLVVQSDPDFVGSSN